MYEHPVNTKSMTKTPMAVAHSPQAQLPTSNSGPAVAHSPRAPDNGPETQEARSLTADEYLSNVSCSNFGSIVDNKNSELDYVSFNVNQINNTAKVITLFVNGRNVEFQVDTGADITCMSCSTFDKLKLVGATLQKSDTSQIVVASGHMVPAQSVFTSSVLVRYKDSKFRLVLRVIESHIQKHAILPGSLGGNFFLGGKNGRKKRKFLRSYSLFRKIFLE